MKWFFKILFNKKLKAEEAKFREKYLIEIKFLIQELKKLQKLMKGYSKKTIEEDLFLKILDDTDTGKIILALNIVYRTVSYVWISRDKVNELMNFVKQARDMFRGVISSSPIINEDMFASNNPDSIFMPEAKQADQSGYVMEQTEFGNKKSPLSKARLKLIKS